jgi:hypothetical protein
MSSRIIGAGIAALAVGAAVFGNVLPAAAQPIFPLEACDAGAFSTEEDFVMQRGEPFDGNPYISDGDLLSTTGQVCARNADLLRVYDVRPDLGLDAVDIIDVRDRVVAFSTELDSPLGNFGAGDVLFTTGGVIPNAALLFPFGVRHDVGLDEVKLMGDPERIRRFVEVVRGTPPDKLTDGGLQQLLKELNVDLWFSIEGTAEGREGLLLTDGDILAASGVVVRRNSDLFVVSIPAGVPTRGVDMGIDAYTARTFPATGYRAAALPDSDFRTRPFQSADRQRAVRLVPAQSACGTAARIALIKAAGSCGLAICGDALKRSGRAAAR